MLVALWAVIAPTLALVFGVAAIAKLRSPRSVDRSFRDLAVPRVLTKRWMRRAFPWCELALAVLLLAAWDWAVVVVAALAVALALAYLVLVARAVAAPDDVSCGCFGETNDRPLDRNTIVRNVVLVLVAGLGLVAVAMVPDARGSAWPIVAFAHGDVVLASLVVAVVLLALGRNGDLGPSVAESLGAGVAGGAGAGAGVIGGGAAGVAGGAGAGALGVGVGSSRAGAGMAGAASGAADVAAGADAADIDAERDSDEPQAVDDDGLDYERVPIPPAALQLPDGTITGPRDIVRRRGAQVLVYVSPTCGPCLEVIEQLPELRKLVAPVDVLLVHARGSAPEHAAQAGAALDLGDGISAAFGVSSRPWAAALGADGLMAGGPVLGVAAIEQFARDIRAEFDAAGVAAEA